MTDSSPGASGGPKMGSEESMGKKYVYRWLGYLIVARSADAAWDALTDSICNDWTNEENFPQFVGKDRAFVDEYVAAMIEQGHEFFYDPTPEARIGDVDARLYMALVHPKEQLEVGDTEFLIDVVKARFDDSQKLVVEAVLDALADAITDSCGYVTFAISAEAFAEHNKHGHVICFDECVI